MKKEIIDQIRKNLLKIYLEDYSQKENYGYIDYTYLKGGESRNEI